MTYRVKIRRWVLHTTHTNAFHDFQSMCSLHIMLYIMVVRKFNICGRLCYVEGNSVSYSLFINIHYSLLFLKVLEKVMDRITEARRGEGGPAAA